MLRGLYKAENNTPFCLYFSWSRHGCTVFLAVLCCVHGLKLYHYRYCLKEMSITTSVIEKPSKNMFNEMYLAGYVLTGFPSLSEEHMTVPQQIEKIMNLKLKPDVLINIKVMSSSVTS